MAAVLQFRLDCRVPLIEPGAWADMLRRHGLGDWAATAERLLHARLADGAHGDLPRWRASLAAIRNADGDRRQALLSLAPWRKGPFAVGGVHIDAEWRSDRKWARVAGAIESLEGRRVLDVGCGNGYYALQMAAAGADCVVGIDPSLLFLVQFLAVNHFEERGNVVVLPARLEEMPLPVERFDTTFSMGVLYHRRSPIEHLRQLRNTLRPGGQLVLETIYVPGEESYACTPASRYARMRNVWLLPTLTELTTWLRRSGFRDVELVDRSITSTDEQRTTEWMPFESLAEALDPDDPTRTVEGWPRPHRVALTATK